MLEQWDISVTAENMDEAQIEIESMKLHPCLQSTRVHFVFQFLPDPPGLEEEILTHGHLDLGVLLHETFTSGIV
jgi:hypothetical protein